ncbi:hypothetical protein DmAi_25520 [Acetobacter persici]|uniref:Uncharacterized protein n=1 Tax=Acetobacter persici TaxID=1076596 RepID=A0A6V8IA84_9PROT|nr:hypothetical protein DmAi_25520 [Acetobacter persici]
MTTRADKGFLTGYKNGKERRLGAVKRVLEERKRFWFR